MRLRRLMIWRRCVSGLLPVRFLGVRVRGFTEPRIFTKPLRDLCPTSSRGFEVIRFAKDVLGVELLPWQEWLLVHMLETVDGGRLRFSKSLVIVGRQNGKTLLAALLAAYWLYVDAARWPIEVPESKFVIVGAAQKLDISMKPWKQVRVWGGPDDPKIGIAPDRVPMLQAATFPPRMVNGEVELRTRGGASYLPRTFDGARGHSAARLVLDELRQQYDFEGWSAIEKSMTAVFDSLLVAFSNAGTAKSVVLRNIREKCIEAVEDAETEWFIAEWSADPERGLDDPVAFQQSNPSAGFLPGMTVDGLMRTAAQAPDETVERIEVLGQWVTAQTRPLIPVAEFAECADHVSEIVDGSMMALAVDVDFDRRYSAVAVAGWRFDDLPHVECIAHRAGILWTVDYVERVAKKQNINRVALRSRGAAASELVEPLKRLGLDVIEIAGPLDGQAAGQFYDAVVNGMVRHRDQRPVVDALAASEAAVFGGVQVFERRGVAVSTAPGIACAYALFALRLEVGDARVSAYEPETVLEDDSRPWWQR